MPEPIGRPDFSTIIRDNKVNLEREAKRNVEAQKAKENLDNNVRSTERREKIRTTELDRKDQLQTKVVEKKIEETQQSRRTEDRSNPRSGDIINVVA
ncbi:MAG: hypothetical protein JNL74_20730 [Fibrobacteres bacterium]|nr:hypothetical protein [Fibrobacterota bacterium]